MGTECVYIDAEGWPVIIEDACTGCGLCPKRCPVNCIKIINLTAESGEPSFQYGVNSFRLYGFVLPKEKGVLGLVGVNGIGKTTALELLRGTIKPNFGVLGKEFSWDEVKKRVRGEEIQSYLKKVYDGEVKVSFKPQFVDKLAKSNKKASEFVNELNEKTDSEKQTVLTQLELNNCLNNKLSELSGGELQRIAIAVTALKKADVYFFDEPTSYLDVKQRMNAAKIIKSLSENAEVIVVEHDLAVLDYLCDYVQVLYGQKGAFGIVSQIKSSKNGVNEFLQGYLKEENVRFRDNEIKFSKYAPSSHKGKPEIVYSGFKKTFKNFSLKADEGFFSEGEIIGVLGPNGIGKSTFAKILAGVEKPDEESDFSHRIAYKPQYLKTDSEETGMQLAKNAGVNVGRFNELKYKLELNELLDKPANEMSGGELQRLSIALCLSQDCDLRVLDEPSAFLDVEQRMNSSDAIKKVTEQTGVPCLVIDHDILFIDEVSNRLMLFEGEPGKNGLATSPSTKKQGMHDFLKKMNLTFRRDSETNRPRVNKPDSQKDQEQKATNNYYYE